MPDIIYDPSGVCKVRSFGLQKRALPGCMACLSANMALCGLIGNVGACTTALSLSPQTQRQRHDCSPATNSSTGRARARRAASLLPLGYTCFGLLGASTRTYCWQEFNNINSEY
eukprot:6202355-Pleurochrysis_carterae.AAC.4